MKEQERVIEPIDSTAFAPSPEIEDEAATQMAKARRAARAKVKKLETEAVVDTVTGQDGAVLQIPRPVSGVAEEASAARPMVVADDPTALWPRDEYGNPISPKYQAMLEERAREQASQDLKANEPLPEVDEQAIADALVAYEAATGYVHQLEAELSGLPGRIQDAVATGDLGQVVSLRARQAAMPTERAMARIGAQRAEIAYCEHELPQRRSEQIAAGRSAVQIKQQQDELEAAAHAAHYAAEDARTAYRECSVRLGQARNQLARMLEEIAHHG